MPQLVLGTLYYYILRSNVNYLNFQQLSCKMNNSIQTQIFWFNTLLKLKTNTTQVKCNNGVTLQRVNSSIHTWLCRRGDGIAMKDTTSTARSGRNP